MLNPVHFRTLIAVIRTGSFADAARRLGYTSSAVSQQMSALERVVKMPLFERSVRSIKPTAAAEILASRAHRTLSHLDALQGDIQEMTEGTLSRVRLGSFPTASQRLLPTTLATFSRNYPNVEILLDEGEAVELVSLVLDGEVDLTLVYRYDLVPQRWPRDLVSTTLIKEDLILILPADHRFASRTDVQLRELENEVWISTREGTPGATCLRRICAQAGFTPSIDFRSNDYAVVRAFVHSGLGVALVPALSHAAAEGVVALHVNDIEVCRHVVALYRSGGGSATITALLEVLQQTSHTISDTIRADTVAVAQLED